MSRELCEYANKIEGNIESVSEERKGYAKLTLLADFQDQGSSGLRLHERGVNPLQSHGQEVNCLGIWARPTRKVDELIDKILERMQSLLGTGEYRSVMHQNLRVKDLSIVLTYPLVPILCRDKYELTKYQQYTQCLLHTGICL